MSEISTTAVAEAANGVGARLVRVLLPGAAGIGVADVRIGLGYTAVQLENGWAGVALTYHRESPDQREKLAVLRPLTGRPAVELLPLLSSADPVEAAVGLATANALGNRPRPDHLTGDVLSILELRPGDRVGMVGYFVPMVAAVKQRVADLLIFERVEAPGEVLRPAAEAERELLRCDVALVTGTTLMNHTLDGLLRAAVNCREVVVLGPSTPMVPEAFTGTSATLLSGVVVLEPPPVLRVVSEGGGMRSFSPFARKVNLRLRRALG